MKKTLFTKITAILMTLFISFTNLPVYASSFQDAPEEYTSEFLDETSTSSTEDTTEDNNNPLLKDGAQLITWINNAIMLQLS